MARLKLAEWAAIAEIVAAFAVILSLAYLAIQVRENTNAVQAATFQDLINQSDEYVLTVAQDSTLASIVQRAGDDPSSLSTDEWFRYSYLLRAFWRNMENAFFQRERGLLGDAEWSVYKAVMCSPPDSGRQIMWKFSRPQMSGPFVSFVEGCGGVVATEAQPPGK